MFSTIINITIYLRQHFNYIICISYICSVLNKNSKRGWDAMYLLPYLRLSHFPLPQIQMRHLAGISALIIATSPSGRLRSGSLFRIFGIVCWHFTSSCSCLHVAQSFLIYIGGDCPPSRPQSLQPWMASESP